MKTVFAASRAVRLSLFLTTGVVFASIALVTAFHHEAGVNSDVPGATYTHGVFRVSIPYDVRRSGSGNLLVEILDPDDAPVGHFERTANAHTGQGIWHEEIPLTKKLAVEDLVWYRLHYRFRFQSERSAAVERIQSIWQVLRTPVVHVIAQNSYLSGATAAVRVIVTDTHNDPIRDGGSVKIGLQASEKESRLLFAGSLNNRGTAETQFVFPRDLSGNYSLHFVVDTSIGSTDFTHPIHLDDKVSILLTTEKPVYQPGQTIHIRALALNRADHEASSGHKLTFELEDSRGNKVFKKLTNTDAYGIASTEFALADEVNLGVYHLRALLEDAPGESPNTTEIALNVERYILPKFKVALELEEGTVKSKHGYRPGDLVTGTVRANYFFGKPVSDSDVTIKVAASDVSVFEVARWAGKTSTNGESRFSLRLPNYFAGQPLSQGAARVLIEATVKDHAGHSETRGEPITVSNSPLLVTAIPEGGTLIPDLDNQVFVLASYPDGTPAQADIRVQCKGNSDQTVHTDSGGVAIVQLRGQTGLTVLNVEASDQEGNRTSVPIQLQVRSGTDQLLLRMERAVYRVGERIPLRIFSTKGRGSVYVDLIKDGQTIETRDLDIVNGQAAADIPVSPTLAGTIEVNAYLFGADAIPVSDHRLIFVQPAGELKIETALDCPTYKPGEEARIAFRVTNTKGQGVQAALGLQIVDEAVFALAEKQPGFAKLFFYLEQEAMKPRYEIHSLDLRDSITSASAETGQQDRAARALFSAADLVRTNSFTAEFGRNIEPAKAWEYTPRYRAQFTSQVERLANAINAALPKSTASENVEIAISRLQSAGALRVQDSWGNPLRIEDLQPAFRNAPLAVRSAGPDGQFETSDDMIEWLQVRHGAYGVPERGNVDVRIEHDRGPFNGFGQIVGSLRDPSGAVISRATVRAHNKRTGKTQTAITDVNGHFEFAAMRPGAYRIEALNAGFETAAKEVSIAVRDRAILDITLSVGATTEQVMVVDGGIVGGVAGGVIGSLNGAVPPAPVFARPFARADGTHLGTGNAPLVVAMREEIVNSRVIATAPPQPAAHVRSYFPEALYINPEIITDSNGRATISVPLADNITTWRLAMLASTSHGVLGNAASSLKVFQDFFVDLDLPVTLTQGDRVSIPVAIYNYSGSAGTANLQLRPEDGLALADDTPNKTADVPAGRVGNSQFTIEAKRIGKFKLTLSAELNGSAKRADLVIREIEVVPNGREQNAAFNGRLDTTARQEIKFPPAAIPDARTIFVRLYPGALSQVVEGMDSLLQMPSGCFEQTSSSTYPDVLALDYMKRMKKLTPEVHAKAESYIANGYQRLLTFEVPGGGFSWFGNAPANKILTSYGLMEFSDMAKVHEVDERLISRTQQWLAAQQQDDGSWKPDESFINEGATTRYNRDLLRITAYVAWSLENTGFHGPAIEKSKRFIEARLSGNPDAYTLAVLANFAIGDGSDRAFTNQVMKMLLDAHTESGEQAWWNVEETGVFATGKSAAVETTGLAVQALLKWGEAASVTRKAINYITANKDASGTWGTTQATIMALRALLLSTETGGDAKGSLEVRCNGKIAGQLELSEANNDLLHQFVIKGADAQAANIVELRFRGQGALAYQVAGRYFLPWDQKPAGEALSIDVSYDRTHLNQDDLATATAKIRNNLGKTAKMVMVDLGIPPGFELLSEDLQTYQEKSSRRDSGRLEKFSLTATQAILYFDSIAGHDAFTLSFRLRAKYPIRTRTFASRVYEYYDPDVKSVARPVQLEVDRK